MWRCTALICLVMLGFLMGRAEGAFLKSPQRRGDAQSSPINFDSQIKPLLGKYCYGCHGEKKKGDLDLRSYADEASVTKDRAVFEKVFKNLTSHEMPPENKPQPNVGERELLTSWLASRLFSIDCENPDPGRVTIRRLNRVEYNNTIRDLVGVDFQPADDFPADDTGYGFDNIGDVLSLSPVLFEKYLAAAERILNAAIVFDPSTNGPLTRFEAEKLESTAQGGNFGDGARLLGREGEVYTNFNFAQGEYIVRARAFGQQAGPELPKMEFRVDARAIKVIDVAAVERLPRVYETRIQMAAGEKRIAAAYINNYNNTNDPPNRRDRNLIIDYLEVVGPINQTALPESHKRIFVAQSASQSKRERARGIIETFAKRAFRRPVKADEVDRLFSLFEMAGSDGESFERSIKLALTAVLASPHFLFRGELQPQPDNPAFVHPIDEFALASRLSYFLWSSMPDEELFRHAEQRTLRKNLESQVRRMLRSEKSKALVENFAGQWLQLRNLALAQPDPKEFPDFNDALREDMRRETELFFASIVRDDRSVLDFIDADYTYVNGRLAQLYGLQNAKGDGFQRVSLKRTPRGGLLTQASILTITSSPTRTSPVKRGKWVLDNILGTPPPPPPADVPELEESKQAAQAASLRQRMEEHRSNPNCSSCHARMDPIGFGFENFDAIGRWRDKEGAFEIDASGKLVSGEAFDGAEQLKQILLEKKREEFVRCLSEKMLTYALGRGLEYYDKCAVDDITKKLTKSRYKFSALVLHVVRSTPFQMRRGEENKMAKVE